MLGVCVGWPKRVGSVVCLTLVASCSDGTHRLGGPGDSTTSPLDPEDRVLGFCRTHADLEMIDDMEDRLDTIRFEEGRSGFWFAFNDGTGTQDPAPGFDGFLMTRLEPPRGESWWAVSSTGSGFTDWGAGIGFDLHSRVAYDATAYAGVAFWARLAPGASDVTSNLRVDITDRNSVPQGFVCNDEDVACYANFGADIVLGPDWQYFQFLWTELSQPGWQDRTYPSIERSALYGIRFQVSSPLAFHFEIDDVMFLCPMR